MPYNQRDVVKVTAELPDGKIERHPFLIISCHTANSIEKYYTGVMMSATKHTDRFSFDLEDNMFERPLEKPNCQLRLYIIVSFREVKIEQFVSRMKKVHFKAVMEEIKNFTFSIDS